MTEPLTLVISGIGGAIVTGLVGVSSSLISYKAASRQLQNQLADNENNRRHQILLSILAKRQQAIEDIWKLLFVMERQDGLSDNDMEVYIRSLVWLPSALREVCLKALEKNLEKQKLDLKSVRDSLIDAANSIDYKS